MLRTGDDAPITRERHDGEHDEGFDMDCPFCEAAHDEAARYWAGQFRARPASSAPPVSTVIPFDRDVDFLHDCVD